MTALRSARWAQWLIFLLMALLACSTLFPILYMILTSLKSRTEYLSNMFGLPHTLFTRNFGMIFDRFNIPLLGMNSLIVAVSAVALSLLITTMAGYGFAKFDFRGSKLLFVLVVACMMVPGQVLIIPVYRLMADFGLINNYLSVILFYTTTSIPFAAFLLTASTRAIPKDLMEAAKIDGAGVLGIYWRVVLPMVMPAVVTLAILNFLGFWNELLYAMLFLQDSSKQTMTVAVATLSGGVRKNYPMLMSGLLLNSVPVIVIFLLFQNQIQKGITMGAVK
ncbi:carbohydrate ABC transporter permease [Paenibacillus sp. GCM10012307]|uniref:Carbohydrate ABC transporter permease n=1 Tax=Paenibacillus roseus TaxID=2798579 RepID=A0A934J6X1_9BACL|nr:carbohydrate ABC transporter permease [Paenibacillus roseus]MBJ6361490.1 carbohydrate ABC transporter permease [Paenibacillus roseus]